MIKNINFRHICHFRCILCYRWLNFPHKYIIIFIFYCSPTNSEISECRRKFVGNFAPTTMRYYQYNSRSLNLIKRSMLWLGRSAKCSLLLLLISNPMRSNPQPNGLLIEAASRDIRSVISMLCESPIAEKDACE